MKENYYDILEISKNASPEIIEKAYKTLVKKYHPDLQENDLKIKYEEKIKKINEAYEVLSDSEKRKNYDFNLKNDEISIDDYNNLYNENINLKNEINYLKSNLNNYKKNYNNNSINNYNNNSDNAYNSMNNIENKINPQKNYTRNLKYNNNSKIYNYSIKKNFFAFILTLLIIIVVSFIFLHIPFTKNYLINLYNQNSALQFIVDLFK